MRLQKLLAALAGVLLVSLPVMTAGASEPGVGSGLKTPSISGFPTGVVRLSGGSSLNLSTFDVTPPPVPPQIRVEQGNIAFLVGHAIGTQNYVCLPSGNGFAFTLFTPQATLFKGSKQIITHFFSPNPFEAGHPIRATWQDSRDTSTIWALVEPGHTATSTTDPDFVAQGAVAWVLLTVVGAQDGPLGTGTLTQTTFVQRLNTSGGVAPSTGCASLADVGHEAFVPYTADYFFYKQASPGQAKQSH